MKDYFDRADLHTFWDGAVSNEYGSTIYTAYIGAEMVFAIARELREGTLI